MREGLSGIGGGATRDEVGALAITTPLSGGSVNTAVTKPMPVGTRVDRYVLGEILGAGGMGVVYRAWDPTSHREVALKLVRPEPSVGTPASGGGQARLLREAQAMARLSHANTVGVYDVGLVDDQVYIAMELIDGVSMGAWLRERPRPWREVLRVMQQAGRGLEAAHAAGLVHRDFKPENVLIGRDGRVCVVDLGLARPVAAPKYDAQQASTTQLAKLNAIVPTVVDVNLTRTGAVLGTPLYMAPEQHQSEKIDARTDQFSFCVSFYEALYGKRPFAADSRNELIYNVVHGQVSAPPSDSRVPPWLHGVVLRGLSTSPSARYPSMTELLDELDHHARRLVSGWSAAASIGLLLVALAVFLLPPATGDAPEEAPPSAAPANLDLEQGELGAVPPGWQLVEEPPGQAAAASSDEGPYRGRRCAKLAATATPGAVLQQAIDATPFRGGRVRLQAAARARITGDSDAALWLRVERGESGEAQRETPVHAGEWANQELVIEVPGDARRVAFGVKLAGQGQIWLDAVTLERIEKGWSVPPGK
ncbi:MAG: serine/threonine protein kinase [Myxococcales bacterium]|nr:serine/threonine protein kinase [Myxococcales bacterium]